MAMDTSEALDLSKENIQPLRQGRNAYRLETALQAQNSVEVQHQLRKEREYLESLIRTYEGEDPLQPYWEYVSWVEQSYPHQGPESNLMLLLENIITKFKDCEKYKQDTRFVQVLIKYINLQPNSLELYQMVYNQGLGIYCSSFYKAWAEELDNYNDFKRADQVFQLGLKKRAQPISELNEAHMQFQLAVGRRLLGGEIGFLGQQTGDEQRPVLTRLKPSSISSSRKNKGSAGTLPSARIKKNDNKAPIKVYEEKPAHNDIKISANKLPTMKQPLKGNIMNKENVIKASKWCGEKQQLATPAVQKTPSFTIHEDPEAACENRKTITLLNALKPKKEHRCPVAVFEPPNDNLKPMYPKHLVYAGGRDYSLEEIRAEMYWKSIRIKESENEGNEHKDIVKAEIDDVTFNEMKNENERITENIHNSPDEECNEKNNYVDEEQVRAIDGNRVVSRILETSDKNFNDSETKNVSNKSMTTSQIEKQSSNDADKVHQSSLFGSVIHSPSTSITVNTRAAMNVVQQMWTSPSPKSYRQKQDMQNDEVDNSAFKIPFVPKPKSITPFTLYSDENEDAAPVQSMKPRIPFQIFADESSEVLHNNAKQSVTDAATTKWNIGNMFSFDFENSDSKKRQDSLLNRFSNDNIKSAIPSLPFEVFREDSTNGYLINNDKSPKRLKLNDVEENKLSDRLTSEKLIERDNFSDLAVPLDRRNNDENAIIPYPKLPELPYVPPPDNDEFQLFGSENKENDAPDSYVQYKEKRRTFGILIPNRDIPIANPNDEIDEEENNDDNDDYDVNNNNEVNNVGIEDVLNVSNRKNNDIRVGNNDNLLQDFDKTDSNFDDVTCNTKAFAFVLTSSTPFAKQCAKSARKSQANSSFIEDTQNTTRTLSMKKTAPPEANLSMILETSKERYTGSSGSSGNSSSAVISKTFVLTEKMKGLRVIKEQNTEIDDQDEQRRANNKNVVGTIDPFDENVIKRLLDDIDLAKHSPGYTKINCNLPILKTSSSIKLGNEKLTIINEIGKGAYAKIFKAQSGRSDSEHVAVKIQKPACEWEWYIIKELHLRLSAEQRNLFINCKAAYIYNNGSVLLTKWAPYGNLLELASRFKLAKNVFNCPMYVCTYLILQMISAIEYLHSCEIIHGDVKPDNFVITALPSSSRTCIQLIDFGRSIDMKLFPGGTQFTKVVTTEDFQCHEMRENKPWTYQTDLYGLAGSMYVVLMGDYMKTVKRDDTWTLLKPLPRYMRRDIWDQIFDQLLNIKSCELLPNLAHIKDLVKQLSSSFDQYTIRQQLNIASNILCKK